jgi:hypothetical protein
MAALSQTASLVVVGASPVKANRNAGGTITAGMPVYSDLTDSNLYKAARANAQATAQVAGIALNGASDNQPVMVQSSGEINLGATLIVGESYYLSDAVAGQIVPVADLGTADWPVFLGIAKSASLLDLNIVIGGAAKA